MRSHTLRISERLYATLLQTVTAFTFNHGLNPSVLLKGLFALFALFCTVCTFTCKTTAIAVVSARIVTFVHSINHVRLTRHWNYIIQSISKQGTPPHNDWVRILNVTM